MSPGSCVWEAGLLKYGTSSENRKVEMETLRQEAAEQQGQARH